MHHICCDVLEITCAMIITEFPKGSSPRQQSEEIRGFVNKAGARDISASSSIAV
jgi:hypothetical protein